MARLAARRQGRTRLGALEVATVAVGTLLTRTVLQAFVEVRFPTLSTVPHTLQRQGAMVRAVQAQYDRWNDPYQAMSADDDDEDQSQMFFNPPQREAVLRDVKVTDIRDINELLKLPNPLRPTLQMQLKAVTLDDGTRIERPTIQDLKRLQPSNIRPVTFHWKDRTRTQTRAPKQYDEIIQRLLNAGPADMEDLVRANWKMFDRGFFFRLTELKQDANDARLKEKIINLENLSLDIVKAAQTQMRKMLPDQVSDARDILNSMLEEDRTLLWPPTPESYKRLAEAISTRAIRNKYEDAWFETCLEICERYGTKMEKQGKKELTNQAKVVMQRLITEWLRHDSLWEETAEGEFIALLMGLSHEQWADQLFLWTQPMDTYKLRDEIKIISENKVVQLPMGSKLQIYAAKYLQGLVEFIESKDELLQRKGATVANR